MNAITFDGTKYELFLDWKEDLARSGRTVATGYRDRTDMYGPGSRTQQRTQVEVFRNGTVMVGGQTLGRVELPS
jgi:hypothetical protein